MDRPRIEFFQGVWTLQDRDAEYSRELTLSELENLLADGLKHIELCLRVASVRPPKPKDSDGW